MRMKASDSSRIQPDAELAAAILACFATGKERMTLSPTEIAQRVAGTDWHTALGRIRRVTLALAREGSVVIYRKGKPVDPDNFKGVYRVGLPRHD